MADGVETAHCPLCGCKSSVLYTDCVDHMVSGESFNLERCTGCGVVFTFHAPAEEELSKYEKLQLRLELGSSPKGLMKKAYYKTRTVMMKRKADLIRSHSPVNRGRMLNYGAKTGFFSNYMQSRGWDVTSVERNHEERVFCLELFHHRMISTEQMQELPHSAYDVVTLWHVFEHAHKPEELLDHIFKLMKENGILVMAVPNMDSADSRHYGKNWAALDVPRHLWHFTAATLQRLALRHGFIMTERERMPFDSFYISVLSEKGMGHKFATARGLCMGLYFWFISLWHKDRSSSMMYVFRKKSVSYE